MDDSKSAATSKLGERIRNAFSDAKTQEYAPKYLELIQLNSRKADEDTGRLVLTIFGVMLLFELITQAAIQEVSIGPFKVSNLSTVHRLLPIILAYYYFDLATTFVRAEHLTKVHQHLVGILYEPIERNKLSHYALSTPSIYEVNYLATAGRKRQIQAVLLLLMWVLILFVAPWGFEIYVHFRLFMLFGISDILTWMSLIVSAMFMIQASLTVVNFVFSRDN